MIDFMLLSGFGDRQTNKRMDIGSCRVALVNENIKCKSTESSSVS